jgi:hypothetical protein
VRLVHRDSGAVGQGVVHREQYRNEREALRNLAETREFRNWHRMETARRLGKRREETQEEILARVDKMIESGLRDGSIVVEEIINGNEE